ncbi:hypothetical protein SAMN05192541_10899 [Bradyrhizobium arachidis]|nr:hypothetical protein SAMN05192541_10899 [Bradyrhizobium arachidis]
MRPDLERVRRRLWLDGVAIRELRRHGIDSRGCFRPRPRRFERRPRFSRKHCGACGTRSLARGCVHRDMGRLSLGSVPRTVVDDQHCSDRQAGHDQRNHAGMAKRRGHGVCETIHCHRKTHSVSSRRLIQIGPRKFPLSFGKFRAEARNLIVPIGHFFTSGRASPTNLSRFGILMAASDLASRIASAPTSPFRLRT